MSRMITVLCSCLCIVWGCSKSSSPTSDGGGTTLPDTVHETISTDGGIIQNSGMSVTIPEGMLSEDTEIILAEAVETSYAASALTATYTIDGIPESATEPLTVKLVYDGETPEALTIAVGEQTTDQISGESLVPYRLFSATLEDGWIVAEVTVADTSGSKIESGSKTAVSKIAAQIGKKFYVKGLEGYQQHSDYFNTFSVEIQVFWEEAGHDLANYCYDIYKKFRSLNMPSFSIDGEDWLMTPINVKCIDRGEQNTGRMLDIGYQTDNRTERKYHRFMMYFNELRLGQSTEKIKEMKYEAGMQIFDIMAYIGNPVAYKQAQNRWAYNAMKEWAAINAAEDTTCYAYWAEANPAEPLKGFHHGLNTAGQDSTNYGRGMTAVIKYLDDLNGADGSAVVNFYTGIQFGNHSVEALTNSFDGSTDEWWPGFVETYLAGGTYPIDTDAILDSPAGSWTIDASAQPSKDFTRSYGDLSAAVYRISLESASGDPDRSISFSADGQVNPEYLTIMLYKKDSQGSPVQIMKGSDISLSSMKEFMNEHTDELYAIVVNSACDEPFSGQSSITLTVSTEEQGENPDIPIVDPNLIFVTVPAGSFDMGSEKGSVVNKPVHRVRLDSFEMTTTEITNYQFVCFLNAALATEDILIVPYEEDGKTIYVPYTKTVTGSKANIIIQLYHSFTFEQINAISYDPTTYFTVEGAAANNPVGYVSWYGAAAFAEYYDCRLPAEAEWEYACRAGTTTDFYTGDEMDETLNDAAWGWDNSLVDGKRIPHQVGQKTPNDWGLYDMHGNVEEWCNDHYESGYYEESPEYDPQGPENGSFRVNRGGSVSGVGASWQRDYGTPSTQDEKLGFRVVNDL